MCFLMFATLSFSSILAIFLKDINQVLNLALFVIFISAYLVCNLSLFKFIFHLLDHETEDLSLSQTLPTKKQIINFLIGSFFFTLSVLGVYIIVALLVFPFVYTGISMEILTNLAISLGLVAIFITWLRISFFPFFIIDKEWRGNIKPGKLGDIAPTILTMMKLPIPAEMTGNILIDSE